MSWQRKVMVTQESINKLKDTDAAKALAERQERLLQLMARVREQQRGPTVQLSAEEAPEATAAEADGEAAT